jgi:hypothetical protein
MSTSFLMVVKAYHDGHLFIVTRTLTYKTNKQYQNTITSYDKKAAGNKTITHIMTHLFVFLLSSSLSNNYNSDHCYYIIYG